MAACTFVKNMCMKKLLFTIFSLYMFQSVLAQGILDKFNKKLNTDSTSKTNRSINDLINRKPGGNKLSSEEIIDGLKEALSVGTNNTTLKLGAMDGFYKDELLRIVMPEEAKQVESVLRKAGMGSMVDKAILSMNRAAEDATKEVGNIFLDAIKGMTVNDGLSILKGGDFAATEYLRKTSNNALTEKMRPVIETSLKKFDATTYWKDIFTQYNRLSFKKVDTDLVSYVTDKSLDALFYTIGQEEQKIRKDPAAQVTSLLKKVFAQP
jgi:hypothetical protein